MGAYIYEVKCTGCDFKKSILDGSSRYIFEGNPKKKPAIRNYGYCYNCKSVNEILEAFTVAHLGIDTIVLSSLREKNNRKSLIGKILNFKTTEEKEAECAIEKEKERLVYFEQNNYQPRCFRCSSFDIKFIDLPNTIEGRKVLIDEIHSCGGNLYVHYTGVLRMRSKSTVRYNSQGLINPKTSIDFAKKLALKTRIEAVIGDGAINGFFIYLNQDVDNLNNHFRHDMAQITFLRRIDRRIIERDFIDDRDFFDPLMADKSSDDLSAPRIVINYDQIFHKWKPANYE